jgi:hypothetical protein
MKVLFEGARLITGDNFKPIEQSAFIVEGDRFIAVGRKGEIHVPEGTQRVDLTGKTVMPAMIELHTHLGWWKGTSHGAQNYTRENIHDQLDRFAYCGFSAVLDLGVTIAGNLIYELRDEAPRPGRPLMMTAGHGIVPLDSGPFAPMNKGLHQVATEEQAREAVRKLADRGVRIVKFWSGSRFGKAGMSPSFYRALIDEAHKHNQRTVVDDMEWLPIPGHESDPKDLIRAGVDGFAHATLWKDRVPDDELVTMLAARPHFFLITTLLWMMRSGHRPRLLDEPLFEDLYPFAERDRASECISRGKMMELAVGAQTNPCPCHEDQLAALHSPDDLPAILAREHAMITRTRLSIARLKAAGLRIGLGSDCGGGLPFQGITSHMELENQVAAGLTPMEAIIGATRTGAEILGLNAGMVARGKSADFIVLDANPLDDIANTRWISSVFIRGVKVERDSLKKKSGWTLDAAATVHELERRVQKQLA